MAWTAEIKSKIVVDGLLKVTVAFTDGAQTFTTRYETRKPEPTWLDDNITATIKSLKTTISFANALDVGIYNSKEDITVVLTDSEIYQKKLQKLRNLKNMIDLKIITEENEDYIKLKGYLTENFNISYIND